MARWTLRLDAAGVNAAMGMAFDGAGRVNRIRELEPGRILIVQDFSPSMVRPGGAISGPTLMALADEATYALIFAHVGAELMAVTTSLNINFLRPAKPGPIHVDCRLLALGRRNVVCDVRIWTESPERIAAQATVTYARAREPAAA
ncbi:MAG TPA: PaaI family thioesterase [Caulobacteraceae bacterium]|nr:PaaI family thioesterase [Caulobacteraceae bacterium]